METINYLFQRLFISKTEKGNFELNKILDEKHPVAPLDVKNIDRHKKTCLSAFHKYLYYFQIEEILSFRRSEVTDDLIERDFFSGNLPPHEVPKDEHYQQALKLTAELFSPPTPCRPTHIFDVKHHYPMKNHPSAEAPFSTEEKYFKLIPGLRRSVGNMKDIIFEHVREWHHNIKHGLMPSNSYLYHMILHVKTAIIGEDDPDKVRSIFGVPKPWIIAQIMFFWSLFAHYKRTNSSPLLWGYETFNGGWFRLNAELHASQIKGSILMIDWKRFDKHARFSVCNDLFLIMRSYLDFSRGYVPTANYPDTESDWSSAKTEKLERLWNWTVKAFYDTPVLLPDGRLYTRLHSGIPSGLFITQFLDSMYNCIMLLTILSRMGIVLTRSSVIKLMGDDSLIQLPILIDKTDHSAFLAKMQFWADHYFGSIISLDKSKISNRINGSEVLSYVNHNGLPHRDSTKLLAQLYHTKARSPTPARTMASAIGIAYASCGWDHQVYNVCKDIYEYYLSEGYSPDPAGLTIALGEDPFSWLDIQLDHFPSVFDIQNRLTTLDYKSDAMKRFWPEDHFLAHF